MDRLKTLQIIVYMLGAILALELVFLIYQIKPQSFALWVSIGVIAIACTYLVGMSVGLLKELKELKNKK